MKISVPALFLLLMLPLLAAPSTGTAQPAGVGDGGREKSTTVTDDSSGVAGAPGSRPWYDTLTVTQPRYARATPLERLALSAFTAVSIPVGLAIGATTILPPSITVLQEDDELRAGVAFSTGIGFGGDTTKFIFFPDVRLQLEGAYFFTRTPQPVMRAGVLFDAPIASIHSRDFVWFGMAGGSGLSTDLKTVSPYLEGWMGLLTPMGIRFLTLFPMHNYGFRTRAGYNTTTGRLWYEFSISATSTFW